MKHYTWCPLCGGKIKKMNYFSRYKYKCENCYFGIPYNFSITKFLHKIFRRRF